MTMRRKLFDARTAAFRALCALFAGFALAACQPQQPASPERYQAVDGLYEDILAQTGKYRVIAEIDHSRLASEAGEVMPPARVVLFSDPEINTEILRQNPRAGLDLPFRMLAFDNGQTPAVVYTSAGFLARRHGLSDDDGLRAFAAALQGVTRDLFGAEIIVFDPPGVEAGQGIVTLHSSHDFESTIERLKTAMLADNDTVWFGEIDYRAEAVRLGEILPALRLLLFGAPGPGGKAMANHPRMGLDAFCQKVLVYEAPEGPVEVLFNDMASFAQWHHGDSALPHKVISRRMRATLGDAVED